MHLCVTGTVKQNGESPSHGSTVSYTTASALVLLNTTHHLCRPKAAKPGSFAAVSRARTSTVTKSVPWLRFGHRAALGGCSLAVTKMHQTRCDSESSFTARPALLSYLMPVHGWWEKQVPWTAQQSSGKSRLNVNPAAAGTGSRTMVIQLQQGLMAPGWAGTGSWAPRQEDGQEPGEARGPLVSRGPWRWVPN